MKILIDASYPSRPPRVYATVAPTVRDYGSGGNKMPFVLDIPRSTSMQPKSTRATSQNTKTMETLQKSTQPNSQTSTSSSEASLVRRLASQVREVDLRTPGGRSFMRSLGFSEKSSPDLSYWKTSKGSYLMTEEELSKPSSPRLLNWGTLSNGKCLTQRISESPRIGKECTLSDILEDSPDVKYSLSKEAMTNILTKQTSKGALLHSLGDQQGGATVEATTLLSQKRPNKGMPSRGGGDSVNLSVLGSKTRRGRVGKGVAQTLDTGMQQYTLDGATLRRLTPVECERLMGFPDHWTSIASDSQRYKMCGNAVVTNVVQAIVENMIA